MPDQVTFTAPRIMPNVFYDDVKSALDWLAKTFGFETRM